MAALEGVLITLGIIVLVIGSFIGVTMFLNAIAITDIPKTKVSQLTPGGLDWLRTGNKLSEIEKIEYASLIKFIQSRNKWHIES